MAMRAKQFPGLFFVLQGCIPDEGFDVYAVDTKVGGDGCKPVIKLLFNFKPRNPPVCRDRNMVVVVCGSKLCAVGGGFDRNFRMYPNEFLQFDLTNWKNRKAADFKPDDAPKPKGGKPFPIVFVHGKKLYALAGIIHSREWDEPDPAFEVYDPYDPYGPSWKTLEPPPFEEYQPNKPETCFLRGYNFVEGTLYVALCSDFDEQRYIYLTYSVIDGVWKRIFNVDKSDTILANLTLYGLYCKWKAREDFHGLMGYHLTGKKVLAHDLTAKVDEKKLNRVLHPFSTNNGPVVIEDADYPYLRVRGLKDITELGGDDNSTGFVAHLAGDIYCAVHIITTRPKCNMHAYTFELPKLSLTAKVLGNAHHSTDWNWTFRYQWGKMESQSQRVKLNR